MTDLQQQNLSGMCEYLSDTMLVGVLRMPVETYGTIHLFQFVQRAREAADRIEQYSEKLTRLKAENERLLDDLIAAETRLELWVSDGSKVAIGDLDGIGCRDETIKILQNNNDALLADAKRYRWLKTNHLQLGQDCWIRTGDDLDEATREALKEGE